jgi:hypothetical protein
VGSYRNTKNEGSDGLMTFGYIVYGNMKPEWLSSTKDLKKEMERVKKEAEKHGFNMNYWGHPYGVSENIVVVYNSEKGLDAYFNMGLDIPFTGNRTNLVIIP